MLQQNVSSNADIAVEKPGQSPPVDRAVLIKAVSGHSSGGRIMAYAKDTIKPITIAHDSSLRMAVSNHAPAARRIAENGIAANALAKHADSAGTIS
jgi:hypothetical protein